VPRGVRLLYGWWVVCLHLQRKGLRLREQAVNPSLMPSATSGSGGSCPKELSGSDKGPHPESPGQAASQSGV
jgi:hypothetical protein